MKWKLGAYVAELGVLLWMDSKGEGSRLKVERVRDLGSRGLGFRV